MGNVLERFKAFANRGDHSAFISSDEILSLIREAGDSALAASAKVAGEATLPEDVAKALRAVDEAAIGWPDDVLAEAYPVLEALARRASEMEEERDRLKALVNMPGTDDFLESVRTEAAHQITRWGAEHDAGKTHADWFWLIGYLGGKALTSAIKGNREKALHHVITTAAACLNWHRAITGVSTAMRPGIADPETP